MITSTLRSMTTCRCKQWLSWMIMMLDCCRQRLKLVTDVVEVLLLKMTVETDKLLTGNKARALGAQIDQQSHISKRWWSQHIIDGWHQGGNFATSQAYKLIHDLDLIHQKVNKKYIIYLLPLGGLLTSSTSLLRAASKYSTDPPKTSKTSATSMRSPRRTWTFWTATYNHHLNPLQLL